MVMKRFLDWVLNLIDHIDGDPDQAFVATMFPGDKK